MFSQLFSKYPFFIFQRYGLSPSYDELKATGGTCPICYDNLSLIFLAIF